MKFPIVSLLFCFLTLASAMHLPAGWSPVYSQATERLQQIAAHVTPVAKDILNKAEEVFHEAKAEFTNRTADVNVSQIVNETTAYVTENPGTVAKALIFTFPQIITTPVLTIFGFGSLGPVASSLAAGYQRYNGNPAARGLFAYLQSARMYGYGAAVVNNAARVVVGSSLGHDMWNYIHGARNGTDS